MAEEMGQDIEVWRQVFQMLIQEVKPRHKWTLSTDKGLLPNVLQRGWMQYQLWTFARFRCSSCSRSWASAHVQVLFHMHWSEKKSRGQVKMRVFAQRCKKCSQPPFEVPEFAQENIERVLNNLVIRILKKCYREGFKMIEEIPAVKKISLQGPHDSKNCEACVQGFCALSGLGLAMQSSVPTPSKDTGEPRLTVTGTSLPCSKPASKEDKLLTSIVSSEVPNPLKTDPKVKHISEPSTAPRFLTQQVPPKSTVSSRVPNPPEADPKVRHISEPSTAPRFLTQQVPPKSTVSSRVPNPPEADPKVRHISEPSTAPRFLTQQLPPMPTVSPKASNPLKVRHSSEPPTAPRFPTQQVPTISSLAPELAIQMPSPSQSSLAANTIYQVERRIQIFPSSEFINSCPLQNCTSRCLNPRCCCLILIIVIVMVITGKITI